MWYLTVIDDGDDAKVIEFNSEICAVNSQNALVKNGCMVKRRYSNDTRIVEVVAPSDNITALIRQRNKLRNLVEDSAVQLKALEKRLETVEDTGLA